MRYTEYCRSLKLQIKMRKEKSGITKLWRNYKDGDTIRGFNVIKNSEISAVTGLKSVIVNGFFCVYYLLQHEESNASSAFADPTLWRSRLPNMRHKPKGGTDEGHRLLAILAQ